MNDDWRADSLADDEPIRPEEGVPYLAVDSKTSWMVFLMMLGLGLGGWLAFRLSSRPAPPPSPEVAADPLLMRGREIFLGRCATCHGNEGRGDGPIAGDLGGPPVGNLTDQHRKHGQKPEEVVNVIRNGVPNTRMDGWSRVLDPPDLRAVAAYVYHLANLPVPEELRKPQAPAGEPNMGPSPGADE